MSKVTIQGDANGTGIFTIASPNSNTDRTLTLPDEAGTVLTSASNIPAANLTGSLPAIDGSALTGVGGVTSLNGETGAITNTSINSIGSYVGSAWRPNVAAGSTVAGSSLYYAYWNGSSWSYPSFSATGTWRFMGGVRHVDSLTQANSALFVRIS